MISAMWDYVRGLSRLAGGRSTEAHPPGGRPVLEPVEPRLLLSASVYTIDADFDQGAFLNLNASADQVQINAIATPLPYVNVACTGRGTLVRIDSRINSATEIGAIVGEYATAPDGMASGASRMAVDLLGNVWVANTAEESDSMGSVTRIGVVIGGTRGTKNPDGSFTPDSTDDPPVPPGEYLQGPFVYNTAIDRDGDGLIRTSGGLSQILPWTNAGGADSLGGVSTAEDEAVINYTRTTANRIGMLAIDGNNDVWVGGVFDKIHEKLSGLTGQPIAGSQINLGTGGYGGVVDANGVLWSVSVPGPINNNLLRYDTNTQTGQTISLGLPSSSVGIDNDGNVWVSNHWETSIQKVSPDGTTISGPYFTGNQGNSQGVAVTPADGSVWVANQGLGSLWGLDSDTGVYHTTASLGPDGPQPVGVSVDAAGKVWTANSGTDSASRVNPATAAMDLTVDLGAGSAPFCTGDMTGMVAVGTTSRQGIWTVVEDGGEAGAAWETITWNAEPEGSVPAGASLLVQARAADTQAGLAGAAFVPVVNAAALSLTGQFLEVQVTLKAGDGGASPVLSDLTIELADEALPPVADAGGPYTVAEGETVVLDGSGSTDPNQDPETLTYEWDLDGDAIFGEIGADAARGDEVGVAPVYSAAGLDGLDSKSVALKVTNDAALSDTSTATVEITNVAPTAVDDGYATDAAEMFDLLEVAPLDGVLANDSDPAGALDPLAVTSTGGLTTSLGATVVMNADGSFSYDATTSEILLGLGQGATAVDTFDYTVSDGDGGSATASVAVTVTGTGENSVHVIDSPDGDGTKALVVKASSSNDDIDVKVSSQADQFKVKIKSDPMPDYLDMGTFKFGTTDDAVSKVIVYGLDGNDKIKVHSDLEVVAWLFGGQGADDLRGGKGDDLLVGGDGDDMLAGNQGRDLLIGGLGADRIVGNAGEDILVAGATLYDRNVVALSAIMAEWRSANDFETRVAHIMGPVGGLNGSYFFNADAANGPVTVFDEDAQDRLTGGSGSDWFLANLNGDGVWDKITDLKVGDEFTELDLTWIDSDPPDDPPA